MLLLRVARWYGEFCRFLFLLFSLSSQSPSPATAEGSPGFPPLPACSGPCVLRLGTLERCPSGFLSPLDARPAVSGVAAPAAVLVPGASD